MDLMNDLKTVDDKIEMYKSLIENSTDEKEIIGLKMNLDLLEKIGKKNTYNSYKEYLREEESKIIN